MLEKMNIYFKGLPWIGPFFEKKKHHSSAGIVSLYITSRDVSVAFAKKNSGKIEIQWVESLVLGQSGDVRAILEDIVRKHHLENMLCYWIISPSHYQFLQMEALPVSPTEFQAAIRWKIKDMIAFPIEDAIIDYFPMPDQQSHNFQKMITVVVSQASYLQPIVEAIQASRLNLEVIDIQSLGLRNITGLFESDEKSSALIYLEDKLSQIIVTRQKTLYFSRYLDFGLDTIALLSSQDVPSYFDKIGLEIQRSFDYYQGQWRQPIPTRIFLATSKGTSHPIENYLSQRLTMPVQLLDFSAILMSQEKLTVEQQGKYLPVIGGLLRNELTS